MPSAACQRGSSHHPSACRYEAALTAAQLAPDLDQLDDADLTEIGERGITLSGGQKQRVALARAVYADADVYILDDPLSAVDAHVGQALFAQCIAGALRSKTVLLVTNALHVVHRADQVVWLVEGEVRKRGTYAEVSADPEFEEMVGQHVMPEDTDAGEGAPGARPAGKPAAVEGGKGGKEGEGGKGGARMNVGAGDAKNLTGALRPRFCRACCACTGPVAAPCDVAHLPVRVRLIATIQQLGRHCTLSRTRVYHGNSSFVAAPTARHQHGLAPCLPVCAHAGKEERLSGNIGWRVIISYVRAGGGLPWFLSLMLLYGIEQGARVYTDAWVGQWAAKQYGDRGNLFYLGIYGLLAVGFGFATYMRSIDFVFGCVRPPCLRFWRAVLLCCR